MIPLSPSTAIQNTPASWEALAAAARHAAARLPALPRFEELLQPSEPLTAALPNPTNRLLTLALTDPSRHPSFASFQTLGYTFWNTELLEALTHRLTSLHVPRWLEVAAGTGRWAAELARQGLPIAATDNHAQAEERVQGKQRAIQYGEWVAPLDAREAVKRFQPEGLLVAWPPLGSCLVPDLLHAGWPGTRELRALVCIGEPDGASELPTHPSELPPGWHLESWPECERYLVGFNDPLPFTLPRSAWRSHSRLLAYLREDAP